ncbi:MAG: ribonuclease III [Eubacteriales bacterium]|nr:ribonuclease III [Eubacteriales bacterium]
MKIDLGYNFKNKKLLETAITHTSFTHENKRKDIEDNERLEFLGDAVLELVISSYIFKKFGELSEGELTKLRASIVCESSLAERARVLKIGENLRLGKGEEQTGGKERDSLLADAFEAIIGAIYIDSNNIEKVSEFIIKQMENTILEKRKSFLKNDCKTYLQELIQKNSKIPIEYTIIEEDGPAHNKMFTVSVIHNGKILGEGKGKSKKDAEQNAAQVAIKIIESKI